MILITPTSGLCGPEPEWFTFISNNSGKIIFNWTFPAAFLPKIKDVWRRFLTNKCFNLRLNRRSPCWAEGDRTNTLSRWHWCGRSSLEWSGCGGTQSGGRWEPRPICKHHGAPAPPHDKHANTDDSIRHPAGQIRVCVFYKYTSPISLRYNTLLCFVTVNRPCTYPSSSFSSSSGKLGEGRKRTHRGRTMGRSGAACYFICIYTLHKWHTHTHTITVKSLSQSHTLRKITL